MANIFSGKTNKQIPASLNECTREDPTVSNLHIWAERLETWGRILFWGLISVGIFVTLITTIEAYELLEELDKSVDLNELALAGMEIPSVWEVFLSNLWKWGLYAFLEYCAYHALALLISALASITQNTIITANVSLFKASGGSAASETAPQTDTTPKSTINNMPPRTYNRPTTPLPNMWECKHCLTYNKNEYGQCKNCGKFRS